jgi:hypothetical protein
MVLIVVLAAGLAAMKVATLELAQVSWILMLIALLLGTLGAIVRRDREAWIGFSLFGWAYVVVALVPSIRSEIDPIPKADKLVDAWIVAPIHPPVPQSPNPLPFLLQKEEGVYFKAPLGGGIREQFQPTPAEASAIDAYLDAMDAARERGGRAWIARTIFYSFAGLAFALVGAVAGKALSQRPTPPGTTSSTPTD